MAKMKRLNTHFCERVIHKKIINKKNLVLNTVSSSIDFSKEFINKSNSNSIDKKYIKHINDTKKRKYHSNKVSDIHFYMNGISKIIQTKTKNSIQNGLINTSRNN